MSECLEWHHEEEVREHVEVDGGGHEARLGERITRLTRPAFERLNVEVDGGGHEARLGKGLHALHARHSNV